MSSTDVLRLTPDRRSSPAITDEVWPLALVSTRNRLTRAMHQGCDLYSRAASTGDAEVPCTEVWPSSVSNLSAHLPRHAMHTRTSPRPASTDELGRCDAAHGAGEQCVGAALASHGRGHRFETCHAHQPKRSQARSDTPFARRPRARVCSHPVSVAGPDPPPSQRSIATTPLRQCQSLSRPSTQGQSRDAWHRRRPTVDHGFVSR
jgi:hypothetical protein